jgi:hypothetical protein
LSIHFFIKKIFYIFKKIILKKIIDNSNKKWRIITKKEIVNHQ